MIGETALGEGSPLEGGENGDDEEVVPAERRDELEESREAMAWMPIAPGRERMPTRAGLGKQLDHAEWAGAEHAGRSGQLLALGRLTGIPGPKPGGRPTAEGPTAVVSERTGGATAGRWEIVEADPETRRDREEIRPIAPHPDGDRGGHVMLPPLPARAPGPLTNSAPRDCTARVPPRSEDRVESLSSTRSVKG